MTFSFHTFPDPTWIQAPVSNLALDTARDPGAATENLGIPAQPLPTLPGSNSFPIFHLNFSPSQCCFVGKISQHWWPGLVGAALDKPSSLEFYPVSEGNNYPWIILFQNSQRCSIPLHSSGFSFRHWIKIPV